MTLLNKHATHIIFSLSVCKGLRPVAVETEAVHGAAGAERQRITRLVDDASEGVGAGDSGQTVLRTMAPMDQVRKVPL